MNGPTAFRKLATIALALCIVTAGPIAVERHTDYKVPGPDDAVGDARALAVTSAAALGVVAGGTVAIAADEFLFQEGGADTTKTDAQQTHVDLYQSGLNQKSNTDVLQTAYDNYLTDTKSTALMIGKNAYIRSLDNGSTKTGAKVDAKEAIADYYTVKQINLLKAWNASVTHLGYIANASKREEQMNPSRVFGGNVSPEESYNYGYNATSKPSPPYIVSSLAGGYLDSGIRSRSVTLVNQSSAGVLSLQFASKEASGASREYMVVNPSTGSPADSDDSSVNAKGITLRAPNSNYDNTTYLDFSEWKSKWDKIVQQNTNVAQQVSTFVNATYSAWDAGKIDSNDLVDPYIGAREYSPQGNFQACGVERKRGVE